MHSTVVVTVTLIMLLVMISFGTCTESEDIELCDIANPPQRREDCHIVSAQFSIKEYNCCYIEGKADGVKVRACLRILNTELGLKAFKHSVHNQTKSHVSIDCCSSQPLMHNALLTVLLLFPLLLLL